MEKLELGTVEDGTGLKAQGPGGREILTVNFWALSEVRHQTAEKPKVLCPLVLAGVKELGFS